MASRGELLQRLEDLRKKREGIGPAQNDLRKREVHPVFLLYGGVFMHLEIDEEEKWINKELATLDDSGSGFGEGAL